MSDASARKAGAPLGAIWAALGSQGYALTNDAAIGLPVKFRENFRDTYFNPFVLRHDDGDWPADRLRARDVIRYWWRDGHLDLREHDRITITDRAGIPGPREHARVMLLEDPQAKELISTFLALVPPDRRQPDGTFGLNLFRTFTDVVTKPHHDDEQFVILYVLDRVGDGADSCLYHRGDVTDEGEPTADPLLWRQLNPGEIFIFEDRLFKHGATPLQAPPGEKAMRDALVCTVDYRETYLAASA